MDEKKIALIPKVVIAGAMGPKEYGLLLTDQRAIFVLESASKAGIGGALGGAIGAVIADAMSGDRKTVDYLGCDPAVLAQDEKNMCIPHASIQSLRLKKSFSGYHLKVEYTNQLGKTKKVDATLVIPSELAAQRKAEGVKNKAALEEYAQRARQALELALPPAVTSKAELRL